LQAQEPEQQASARSEFIAALKEWTEKLSPDNGPFYSGKYFGFVDIQLVPWALRHACLRSAKIGCIFWKIIEDWKFRLTGLCGRDSMNGVRR
jgi:glutathione S-transferase